MSAATALALRVMDVAIAAQKPDHVLSLFSGGGDSTVATHVAAHHERFDGCVFIDTGTSLPGVQEHVETICAEQGWPLTIIRSPQTYEDMIREYGLPGPGQHPAAYVRLKEKALDAHVESLCTKCAAGKRHRKHDDVMWISGARASESVRRMGTSEWVTRDGAQWWVNPVLDWTDAECDEYREAHDLHKSDVALLVHRSGECQCGTFAARGEREMLCALFPEFAAQVNEWEELAEASGHEDACVWGQRPKKIAKSQLRLFRIKPRVAALACSDCAGRVLAEEMAA